MGRIVTTVRIANLQDADKKIVCDALVDTGASYMGTKIVTPGEFLAIYKLSPR